MTTMVAAMMAAAWAPAATTSGRRSRVMPPMATTGTGEAAHTARRRATPSTGSGLSLDAVG